MRRFRTALIGTVLAAGALGVGLPAPAVADTTTTPASAPADTTTTPASAPADTTPPSPPAPTGPPVSVQISATTVGRPIATGFVGMSVEFPAIRTYTGLDPTAINPVFIQLVRNLAPGHAPVVRIGGNSTDATWLPAPGVHPTPGIHSTITARWLAIVRNLAQESRARLILGLNLKLNSASEIAAEAHRFLTDIGAQHIEAFEIGNEPELYRINPWYTTPAGKGVFSRRPGFDFKVYTREIAQYASELKGDPLAGPVTGNSAWLKKLRKVFAVEPGLKVVTYHRYPLIKCGTTPGEPNYPSIPNLLAPISSRGLLNGEAGQIAYAHSHGATFRVDELNTVACKGQPGVSDTFASALWVLDTLFSMARSGVDGVNIHTLPEAFYKLFSFQDQNGQWTANVKPEYYGLLMFNQAAAPGSRLLQIAAPPLSSGVRAWATQASDGEIHVVLINDNLTTAEPVQVAPPTAIREALAENLSAPSVASTSGVTIGGQSFGDQTSTGTLTGPAQLTPLTPSNGQYDVTLDPGSAVMLALAPA